MLVQWNAARSLSAGGQRSWHFEMHRLASFIHTWRPVWLCSRHRIPPQIKTQETKFAGLQAPLGLAGSGVTWARWRRWGWCSRALLFSRRRRNNGRTIRHKKIPTNNQILEAMTSERHLPHTRIIEGILGWPANWSSKYCFWHNLYRCCLSLH